MGVAAPPRGPAQVRPEEQHGLHPEGWSAEVTYVSDGLLGKPVVYEAKGTAGEKGTPGVSEAQQAERLLEDFTDTDAPAAVVTTQPLAGRASVPLQVLVWRRGQLVSERRWLTQTGQGEPVTYQAPGVSVTGREDTSEVVKLELGKDLAAAVWDSWAHKKSGKPKEAAKRWMDRHGLIADFVSALSPYPSTLGGVPTIVVPIRIRGGASCRVAKHSGADGVHVILPKPPGESGEGREFRVVWLKGIGAGLEAHKVAMRKAATVDGALGVRRNPGGFGVRVLAGDYSEAARQLLGQAELERREELAGSTYWEVTGVPAGWDAAELELALDDGGWEAEALPGGRRDRGPTALWKVRATTSPPEEARAGSGYSFSYEARSRNGNPVAKVLAVTAEKARVRKPPSKPPVVYVAPKRSSAAKTTWAPGWDAPSYAAATRGAGEAHEVSSEEEEDEGHKGDEQQPAPQRRAPKPPPKGASSSGASSGARSPAARWGKKPQEEEPPAAAVGDPAWAWMQEQVLAQVQQQLEAQQQAHLQVQAQMQAQLDAQAAELARLRALNAADADETEEGWERPPPPFPALGTPVRGRGRAAGGPAVAEDEEDGEEDNASRRDKSRTPKREPPRRQQTSPLLPPLGGSGA
jgi:hypothetical protein